MFLGRQNWARVVVKEMALPTRSPAATILLDMIAERAKRYHQMRSASLKLSQLELVLMAVAAMIDDDGVARQLSVNLKLTPDDIAAVLAKLRDAARALALQNGFHALVKQFDQLAGLEPGKSTSAAVDRNWLRKSFDDRRAQIDSADQMTQMAFAGLLARHWKRFLDEHQSPERFRQLPHEQQMRAFAAFQNLCHVYSSRGNDQKLAPVEMLSHYLAAVIAKDQAFETEALQFLQAYTNKHWSAQMARYAERAGSAAAQRPGRGHLTTACHQETSKAR